MPVPLIISLVDPVNGTTVQKWKFFEQTDITIGRSIKCDVSVGHPLVSRDHIRIFYLDGRWQLHSTGRHGTLVNGELIVDCEVTDGFRMQLGSNGPVFDIVHGAHNERPRDDSIEDEEEGNTTMYLDISLLRSLKVDEEKKKQEVESIAENEHFMRLKEQARLLRKNRDKET